MVSTKKKSRRCGGNDNGGGVINNDCVGNKGVVVNINEGEDGGKRGWQ